MKLLAYVLSFMLVVGPVSANVSLEGEENASSDFQDVNYDEARTDLIDMMTMTKVGSDVATSVCEKDLRSRINQLKAKTFLAPFLGVVEVYGGAYFLALAMISQAEGWAALAAGIAGATVGAGVGLAAYGVQQTYVIVRLVQVNQMENALLEAIGKREGSKFLDKLVKKYNHRYEEDHLTRGQLALFLKEANQNESLCNAEMVSSWRKGNSLRKRIPLRRELFAAIHKSL